MGAFSLIVVINLLNRFDVIIVRLFMAHLLGSKSCIQSLRQDVLDLHTTISETVSQSGIEVATVRSWKYPDQLAKDLNILELLNDYQYDPEEVEDNQVTHIVLYEIVIDRL